MNVEHNFSDIYIRMHKPQSMDITEIDKSKSELTLRSIILAQVINS